MIMTASLPQDGAAHPVDFAVNFKHTDDEVGALPFVLLSAGSNLHTAALGQTVTRTPPEPFTGAGLSTLGGYPKQKEQLQQLPSAATTSIGLLVTGARGAGKSAFAQAIATECFNGFRASVVVCHCRELHNKKPEEQRSEFEAMLATAAVNSPSVV